jgi:putrescine aminotransferase
MVSDRVASVITSSGGEFGHGFTYSGHPIACAAALATLDILERDNIVERVAKDVGPYLQKRWAELGDHPIVGHTRGIGMIGSLELVRNKVTKERLEPEQQAGGVCREFCIDNGLVMRAVGDSMIISPQLIMNHEEIDTMIERATKALDRTAQHYSV